MGVIIDISKHQGRVDFSQLKKDKTIEGVIIRCGYGDDFEEQDDERYWRNVSMCVKYNIPFGVYLYSYARTVEQAKSEAYHLLRMVEPIKAKLSLPVYIDLENDGSESFAKECATIVGDILEKEGFFYGVYANQHWWEKYLNGLEKYSKWVARYSEKRPTIKDYDLWQYSSQGKVKGVSTYVDLNELQSRNLMEVVRKHNLKSL